MGTLGRNPTKKEGAQGSRHCREYLVREEGSELLDRFCPILFEEGFPQNTCQDLKSPFQNVGMTIGAATRLEVVLLEW